MSTSEPSSSAGEDLAVAPQDNAGAAHDSEQAEAAAAGLVPIVEAALLAAGKPLTVNALAALFDEHERPGRADLEAALTAIGERCEGRGFELVEVASGFRFQVRERYSVWVGRLWQESPQRYSRALLETLALIAYRQPITRGEIEEIRGVAVSTNIIRTLHERDWIRVVGHRDVPGRPAMYATTRQFLDYFNLKSLDQLPALADLRDLETLNAELGFEALDTPAAAGAEASPVLQADGDSGNNASSPDAPVTPDTSDAGAATSEEKDVEPDAPEAPRTKAATAEGEEPESDDSDEARAARG